MRHLRVSNNSSTCRALFLNQMLYFVMQQLRLLKIIKAVSICNNFLQHYHMTTIESLYKTFSYYSKSKYLSLPSGYSFWKWINFIRDFFNRFVIPEILFYLQYLTTCEVVSRTINLFQPINRSFLYRFLKLVIYSTLSISAII